MLKKISLFALLNIVPVTAIGILSAIAPPIALAQAQTSAINLSITREGKETYSNFVLRAENIAKKSIESQFSQNPSMGDIHLVVVGTNLGAIAPILSIKVSRDRWMSEPKIQRWAMYFPDSKSLLGFDRSVEPTQVTSSPPSPAQPTTPTPSTSENPPSESPETLPPTYLPSQVPTLPLDSPESSPPRTSEKLLRLPSSAEDTGSNNQ